jgi:thioredoxin-related protein
MEKAVSIPSASRAVDLYNKYRDRVHFVVIDMDTKTSPEQQKLVKQYYKGYIPHVVVLDRNGNPLYNSSGEVESKEIERLLPESSATLPRFR